MSLAGAASAAAGDPDSEQQQQVVNSADAGASIGTVELRRACSETGQMDIKRMSIDEADEPMR
jgi:hypothetical protein